MRTVVVAGAGLAGLSAAAELRRRGWDGRLVIIGEERHRPYRRPPLSKEYLLATTPPVLDLPQADDLAAEWRLGRAAAGLDLRPRRVRLAGGEEIGFDGLVIATGAAARAEPPALAHPGVVRLRGLDDATALRDRLTTSRRVLVVGGGFLGTEVAAAAVQLGKDVTLVDRGPQPLLRAVGARVGHLVADLHRSHGVDVRLQTQVRRLSGGLRSLSVQLDDGAVVATDLVVAALGSHPSTGWLAGSGLRVDGGVMVDARGLAAPGVTAAGDVARWPHPVLDHEHVRIEHYATAADQGRLAARALLGDLPDDRAALLPSFWSHQYDWRLQSVGFTGSRFEFTLVDHDGTDRFTGEYRHRGRLVGAITNGRPRALVDYRTELLTQAAAAG
ncbi:NADPH-dependent 2,4-dienoyl-CoA reductase/sulfur reductase-like enzyme [Nocardioides thalensis]|uniref:NADPH-dependent 2,4-dienoyl-CoA reductase/sulfur reductase-like enzyme n=1 Tax=Nocardioides thalensis TaxID=1914755 RepID=A0A853C6Z1_9ACTN|nr:FAD-dependent oxidoreductase [Nocardioides thalensis]NYJ03635.1 NADPH-dependent 2,4-dienoyl-CoA reductase/sulfur reductase-like enzyme [Nocardioides thalensis]